VAVPAALAVNQPNESIEKGIGPVPVICAL
jgi:hypothetical protein